MFVFHGSNVFTLTHIKLSAQPIVNRWRDTPPVEGCRLLSLYEIAILFHEEFFKKSKTDKI